MSYRKIQTASEFIHWIEEAEKVPTLYVMGCFGAPLDDRGKARYTDNHPYNRKPERQEMIRAASSDTFGFDCVCLIKGILWGWTGDTSDSYGGGEYGINGVPDYDSDQMMDHCQDISTDFSSILPGEALGMEDHIGVYIGGGMAIECTPRWKNGVQRTAVLNIGPVSGYPGRTWERHGKLPYFTYDLEDKPTEEDEPAEESKPTEEEKTMEKEKRFATIEECPKYAQPFVKDLIDHGVLEGKGGEKGLDLTEDMIRCMKIMDKRTVDRLKAAGEM